MKISDLKNCDVLKFNKTVGLYLNNTITMYNALDGVLLSPRISSTIFHLVTGNTNVSSYFNKLSKPGLHFGTSSERSHQEFNLKTNLK